MLWLNVDISPTDKYFQKGINYEYTRCMHIYYHRITYQYLSNSNQIGVVMFSVLVSSAVDRGSNPERVRPKTKITIWCFFTKQATFRSKSNDWL